MTSRHRPTFALIIPKNVVFVPTEKQNWHCKDVCLMAEKFIGGLIPLENELLI